MDLFFWPRVAIGLALSLVLFAICSPVLMIYFVVTRIVVIPCVTSIGLSRLRPSRLRLNRIGLGSDSDQTFEHDA